VSAALLLLDDRAAITEARARGFEATGTLGVLVRAAQLGLVDLETALTRPIRTDMEGGKARQYQSQRAEPMSETGANDLYNRDFYAWANEQAALLRAGKLSDADVANIAEEIESMGRAEKRELVSRLAVLLLHLLKWQYQPQRRSRFWQATIENTRDELDRHMIDNPSLKAKLPEAMADAYRRARRSAAAETDLPDITFPTECPWTFEQAMQDAEP